MEADDDDWLEGPAPGKGLTVTKRAIIQWTGLAIMTVDRYIADGCPVVRAGKGSRGFQINSAEFFNFALTRAKASGKPDNPEFNAAKTREKEAQAKLKEMDIERRAGRTVTIDEVKTRYAAELAVVRTRLFAIPSQASDDPETQERIRTALIDALSEITEPELINESE
jgi:hypothetical protein